MSDWLKRASDLLVGGDPGETPFLVDRIIVERAITGIVGSWKVAKTWVVLELAIAIVTGRPAFGVFVVPNPGPVILVLEESGEDALHRRLEQLRRGHGLDAHDLDDLHYAANLGVRLNEPKWKERLLDAGNAIGPRASILDPLARLKGAAVDESSQKEIGPVLDVMRELRDVSGGAVPYVQHTGHRGNHQRGSSDLEGYWESRLGIEHDEKADARTIIVDHREAESGYSFRFRLDFDEEAHSVRLLAERSPREEKVEAHMRAHPTDSANKVAKAVGGNRTEVLQLFKIVGARLAAGGSEWPEPPRNHPPSRRPAGGSPDPPFRGSRTTPQAGGSEIREPLDEATIWTDPPEAGEAGALRDAQVLVDAGFAEWVEEVAT